MSGAFVYHFTMKLILFPMISGLISVGGSHFAFAKSGIDFGSDFDMEFGFGFETKTPSKSKKNKASHLPYCEDVKHLESAPGVKSNRGYCLGEVLPDDPLAKKYEVILFGEFFDKDGELVRIIKRNPILLTLAQFLNICRPLGGFTDSEGIYCQYTVKI